jgi:imidazolonepropionase-like amidohydrolase
MHPRIGLLTLSLAAAASTAGAQRGPRPPARPAVVLISDVTVVDGTGAAPKPHMSILIERGRITRILSASEAAPAADTVIAGTGLFAMPGLVDSHVHIGTRPFADEAAQLRRALRGGVTAVFDMASDTRATSDLSRAVITGEISGPSIHFTALMAGPAFFADPRVLAASRGYPAGEAPWMQSMTSESDIVRAVARAKGTGATAIKLYAALDGALVRRIAEEARKQGLRTVAHAAVFPAKPGELVDAGADMLAHTPYLIWEGSAPSDSFQLRGKGDFLHVAPNASAIERLLERMRSRGTLLDPTLWVFAESSPPDSVARLRTPWMNAVTRRAFEMGIAIVAGTDGLFSRDSLPTIHRELELLVANAGLSPLAAITSATLNGARAIGIEKTYGSIEVGKTADLLLLDANPAEDIRNTRRIQVVVKNGAVVGR